MGAYWKVGVNCSETPSRYPPCFLDPSLSTTSAQGGDHLDLKRNTQQVHIDMLWHECESGCDENIPYLGLRVLQASV